jgi:hypothetical protein
MTRSDGSDVALRALHALLHAPDGPSAAAAIAAIVDIDRAQPLPEVLGGGTLGAFLDEAAAGLSGEADPQAVADALSARLAVLDALADAEAGVAHAEAADASLAGLSWEPPAPLSPLPEPEALPTVPWTFDLDD